MALRAMLKYMYTIVLLHIICFVMHQKLNVCILMMLAHNCRTPFMGRPMEYVYSPDLLGVSVISKIRERNVNSSVHKFYCRVNSVLCDFKDIPCDGKAKLLASYCLDVYGSQLWNYSKHDVDMFFTARRKSIRRLWEIPNTTHCNLLSSINSSVPIVIDLEWCAKFIWSCINSDNHVVENNR